MKTTNATSSREKIQMLLSQTNGLVRIDDVQTTLGVSREKARYILWSLAKRGWLKKLQLGLYRVVPLESSDPSLTDENPWIIANELYSPGYVGGWTAANYWGLTDQLFLKTWIMTTQTVHNKARQVSQHEFILKQIQESALFGLKVEWIENNKIWISDPHKTLLDFLDFPEEYSAASMVDILRAYLLSKHRNIELLKEYAEKVNHRSVLKRLGFLIERYAPQEKSLIEFCQANISKGYSSLSTQSVCTKSIGRWQLRVPETLGEG